MKVMHILDSLNRGGAEMLALDLCRNARANNLDLTFVATGGGELEPDFRNSGVFFQRLERRLPVDLKLARRIGRIAKERRIDVVHTHQAVESLHAYLATRGTDVKRVMTFHLCTADAKNRLALNLLVPRMNANIAVSAELLNCLEHHAGFKTSSGFYVVHNGVDPNRLQASNHKLREELGLPKDALLFGMIGNFYPDARKDQATVCRALGNVFAAIPNAQFVFVGGSFPEAPQLLQECEEICRSLSIAERVHFLGKRSDIPEILHALDVYVHSSTNESLGIAVVEAMMVGLPVIVSDIGALLEVTNNGEHAAVFKVGDEASLAAHMIKLANAPALREKLCVAGQEWAMQKFGIKTHISNLIELYKRI